MRQLALLATIIGGIVSAITLLTYIFGNEETDDERIKTEKTPILSADKALEKKIMGTWSCPQDIRELPPVLGEIFRLSFDDTRNIAMRISYFPQGRLKNTITKNERFIPGAPVVEGQWSVDSGYIKHDMSCPEQSYPFCPDDDYLDYTAEIIEITENKLTQMMWQSGPATCFRLK